MDLALLAARLLLATVFVVSGVAKLADRAGSRQGMLDFGVPAALAGPLGRLLPLAELAVAVALLPTATAWWGAVGGLALLLVFIVGIAASLARGRRPACRCFGQLSASPIGASTVVRNAVLAAVAGFVVLQGPSNPGPSVVGWLGDVSAGERVSLAIGIIALGLLGVVTWLLMQLLRQQGRLLLRLDVLEERLASGGGAFERSAEDAEPAEPAGLPIGAPAPDFALPDLRGETHTLDTLRANSRPVLLLFMDPECGPCSSLMPDVGRWQREHADQLAVTVVSTGSAEANRAKAAEHDVSPILLQNEYEVADLYQAYGTPGAVLVTADGSIGGPMAAGPDQIRTLVARTLGLELPTSAASVNGHDHDHGHDHHGHDHDHDHGAGLQLGDPAPALELPDLDGKTVKLDDFRGQKTLIVFWNPGCGFCQQILPELKAWEANPTKRAPKLLVVSGGDVKENREQGFQSTVVLDQNFQTGRAFGADGTPMAILVNGEGKVASTLASGGPAVLALAGVRRAKAGPTAG